MVMRVTPTGGHEHGNVDGAMHAVYHVTMDVDHHNANTQTRMLLLAIDMLRMRAVMTAKTTKAHALATIMSSQQ